MDLIRSGRSIYTRQGQEETDAVHQGVAEAPGKQCDELKWQQTRQTSGSSSGGGGSGGSISSGGEQSGHSGYTTHSRLEDKNDMTAQRQRTRQVRSNLFPPATKHFADQKQQKHVQRERERNDEINNNWRAAAGVVNSSLTNGNKNLIFEQNLEHPVQRSSTLLVNDKSHRSQIPPSQDFYYSDSQHYLESTLPLNYCQQQQQQQQQQTRSHPFGNSYELTQMQQQQNAQQEDTDAHLYCAVTNMPHQQQQPNDRLLTTAYGLPPPPAPANGSTLTTGRGGQLNHHYQIPSQILHLSTQQQPYSIYKSPTSMTLNQSYQTLIEKLNENRIPTGQQQPPLYSNNGPLYGHSTQPAPYFQGYHQGQSHQVTTSTSSPIFSSITTNTTSAAPMASTPPEQRDRYLEKYMTNTGFRMGHAQRQLKWAFTRPNCWCKLLLLLLISILLLVGIFIVSLLSRTTTTTTNTIGSNRVSQSQLANIPNGLGGGGGPNEFPLSRFQMNLPFDENKLPQLPPDSPLYYPGHTFQPLPPSGSPLLPVTRTLSPNSGPLFQQPNNVINREQNNVSVVSGRQPMEWPTNLAVLTTTTTSSSNTDEFESRREASTQSYWSGARTSRLDDNFCSSTANECEGNGKCDASRALCKCAPGYSGPTCLHADCPNECSHRGECKLRKDRPLNNLDEHQLESFGFQTLSSHQWQLSTCVDPSEMQVQGNNTTRADRLEWSCDCQPGFTGPDCGQLKELQCQDGQDNDLDGLADCEDDDCCAQPICRDNLMCYKPPEPSRMLEKLRQGQEEDEDVSYGHNEPSLHVAAATSSSDHSLFAQWSFLIANGSVQSYAQRKSFARDRVAIVRGRALTGGSPAPTGIASVRVSVIESAAIGFTLTRSDGHFDMLVNGDEWLTLQFMRVAYAPVKRRIFVRAQSINVLDDNVLMWLASASSTSATANSNEHQIHQPQQQQQQQLTKQMPFALALGLDLAEMIDQFRQRDDERRRAQLFECLFADLIARDDRSGQSGDEVRPTITTSGMDSGAQHQQQQPPLRTFALVSQSSSAFATSLQAGGDSTAPNDENLELIYNSAHFPASSSIVKPTVSIRLLPSDFQQDNEFRKLIAINLQLDIEGQTRRERLETIAAGLSYQFAWNRRNVYGQKIYGFSELNVRVSYEYELGSAGSHHLASGGSRPACLDEPTWVRREFRQAFARLRQNSARTQTTFEGRVFMEAHQMNQHADLGKWTLAAHSRYDEQRNVVHFGTGWMLPFSLAYPPIVSKPIELASQQPLDNAQGLVKTTISGGRLLARGPHSSIFVAHASRLVQLDSSGSRRLLDVPLSILTSRFTQTVASDRLQQQHLDHLELLYNNFESALYISSRFSARIVRVSLSSLIVLNRTLSSTSATLAPEDEIDIELLCGYDQQRQQQQPQPLGAHQMRSCKSIRLLGPHSLALDEQNQLLYFVDGTSALMALNLNTNSVVNLSAIPIERTRSVGVNNQQQQAWAKVNQANKEMPSNNQNNCLGLGAKLALADLAAEQSRMHSLAWNKADSSLYFVIDQQAIVALRQDLSLEIVALGATPTDHNQQAAGGSSSLSFDLRSVGAQQQQQHAKFMQSRQAANFSSGLLPLCLQDHAHQQQLGLIKDILLDELSGNELLILHKWPAHYWRDTRKSSEAKLTDRFYLAKLSLGIQTEQVGQQQRQLRVFDLHSAQSTWDQLVLMLTQSHHHHRDRSAAQNASQPVDWKRIVPLESRNHTGLLSLISGGFERVDSMQLNAEGTIYLFDATYQTLRLIETYSPARMSRISRPDSDVSRFFGYSAGGSNKEGISPIGRSSQLSLVQLRNPIRPSELLEFHSETGLLLRRTLDQSKLEFYYSILQANEHDVNGKLHKPPVGLDEDDENDLQVRRLVQMKFGANKGSSNAYVRLGHIIDMQTNRNYEFVRNHNNHHLKSILLEGRPICELSTDRTGALTTFVHQPTTRTSWTELVYDPKTYLLHNVIAKSSSQMSVIKQNTFPYDDKLKRLTRRILYDEMFNHYCDLFTVDA